MTKYLLATLLGFLSFSYASLAQEEIKLSVQTGHSSDIVYLSFSKDGDMLASAGADNKVIIWDVSKRKQIQILSGHLDKVTSVDFHPQKSLIATASKDGQVYIKNLTNGEVIWSKKIQ